MATTYSPTTSAVPSALVGLTSLFGMGRGGPNRYNRPKTFNILTYRRRKILPKLFFNTKFTGY